MTETVYDNWHDCPVCKSSNNVKVLDRIDMTPCELQTECTQCDHTDYWCYGWYQYYKGESYESK
jgi:hypothetical protein